MHFLHRCLYQLQCLFHRRQKEAELADELRSHLEMQIEANVVAGMSADEARYGALRELGGIEQAKELCRDERGFRWVEGLVRDLRHSTRALFKAPGFTLVAIATLAIGIGASTAVFSVVEAVLLRPLPYRDPRELVDVTFQLSRDGSTPIGCSTSELDDLRERSGVFSEVSMVFPMDGNLTGVAEPRRVEALAVSPSYFRLLGIAPALGRTFGAEEESVPGWAQGCVISHSAWINYFGGDATVIGRKFYMDYDTYRVIGVMPRGFRHPGRTLTTEVDVWFTGGLRTAPFPANPVRGYRIIPGVIGRLKPGLSTAAAQAQLEVFAGNVRQQYPADYASTAHWTPRIEPLQTMITGAVRPTLWLLFGAVALVLLICCATLANLLLVRGIGRRQEMAVRCALGASRFAVARQLVVESLLITFAAGLVGLVIARFLPPFLLDLAPRSVPRLNELTVSGPVLGFALFISLLTGLAFGLIPGFHASKLDLVADLKLGVRSAGTDRETQRWRMSLVTAQVALSLMLLITAGLLLRSFIQAWRTEPGFSGTDVLIGRLWLPPPTDPQARQAYLSHDNRVTLMRELVHRFRRLPGVDAAAIASDVPLSGAADAESVTVESGDPGGPRAEAARVISVTPDFFRTLGVPLLRGRTLTDADGGRNRVALVNAAAAAEYWPGLDPIGRRIARGQGPNPEWCTVVGIVGNTKDEGLDAPDHPQLYVPAYQQSDLGLAFLLRANYDAASLIESVRREIHAVDPDLPIYGVQTMNNVISRSLAPRRFLATLIGLFATVALVLAALGIYGVMALTVSHRTQEIGVRMTLGANRGQIALMIVRRGLLLAGIGTMVGALGGLALTRVVRGFLFETPPFDPGTWLGIIVLVLAVSALACWLPAYRAAKISPIAALRCT